jgi:TATA-box binding protein (TBP) (component of TFIID and TFIIIB)
MFPGLIFRPDASPVVLLLFHSGKVVITVLLSKTQFNLSVVYEFLTII